MTTRYDKNDSSDAANCNLLAALLASSSILLSTGPSKGGVSSLRGRGNLAWILAWIQRLSCNVLSRYSMPRSPLTRLQCPHSS